MKLEIIYAIVIVLFVATLTYRSDINRKKKFLDVFKEKISKEGVIDSIGFGFIIFFVSAVVFTYVFIMINVLTFSKVYKTEYVEIKNPIFYQDKYGNFKDDNRKVISNYVLTENKSLEVIRYFNQGEGFIDKIFSDHEYKHIQINEKDIIKEWKK